MDVRKAEQMSRALTAAEGWRVNVSPTGIVTRGDPRPIYQSPFVRRALARELPGKVIR